MLKIYSLFDNKVKTYGHPLFYLTAEEMLNALKDFVNNTRSVNINPIDFDLFFLGEYDQNTGKLTPQKEPEHLINLATLVIIPTTEKDK